MPTARQAPRDAALIFSMPIDNSAAAVQWGLARNGVASVCIPSLSQQADNAISLSIGPEQELQSRLAFPDLKFRSVWYRRAQKPLAPPACANADKEFVAEEWLWVQRDYFGLAADSPDALWVNDPGAALRAENKLVQLHAARAVGLAFPDTLVSNDAHEVRRFIAKHGRVIVKTYSPYVWQDDAHGAPFGTTVAVLDAGTVLDEASIALCPAIYQPLVDKVSDIRVTVVGDRLFPVRFTAARGGAMLDWRPSTFAPELRSEPCTLPAAVETRILQLQKRLGLVFGCIDMAVDRAGHLMFFEVNQSGQFIFVEQLVPELPLLKAFCALLAQRRTDYSLLTAADVSCAQFKHSDAYQEWRQIYRAAMQQAQADAAPSPALACA